MLTKAGIIALLVRRAEAGDARAAWRLHRMAARGNLHPALEPYRKPPQTKSRHRRSVRPRGRPVGGQPARYDADGRYIARSDNTLLEGLPAPHQMAAATRLARREGFRGDAAYQRAADILHARTGRRISWENLKFKVKRAHLDDVEALQVR